MSLKTILFDLDETLYPSENGLWQVLRDRMDDFMRDRLNIPKEMINSMRQNYYETYGTTLRGLEKDYQVKAEDYLAFVHDVPIHEYVAPDPALGEMLAKLPYRKVIFTNADTNHTQRVLAALGITTCFEKVIDVMAMEPYCKPFPEAFQKAMEMVGDDNPSSYLLFDDAPKNVSAALRAGMQAVLVSKHPSGLDHPVTQIDNIHQLTDVLSKITG